MVKSKRTEQCGFYNGFAHGKEKSLGALYNRAFRGARQAACIERAEASNLHCLPGEDTKIFLSPRKSAAATKQPSLHFIILLSLFHGQLVPIFSNVKKNLQISGEETLFFFALVRRASLESLLLKNVFKGLSTINIHMFRDSRLDLSLLDVKKPRVITSNSNSHLQGNKGWLTRSDGSQSCVALSFPFFLSSSLSPPLSLADDSGCVHEIFNYDWLAGGQCLANGVRLKGP